MINLTQTGDDEEPSTRTPSVLVGQPNNIIAHKKPDDLSREQEKLVTPLKTQMTASSSMIASMAQLRPTNTTITAGTPPTPSTPSILNPNLRMRKVVTHGKSTRQNDAKNNQCYLVIKRSNKKEVMDRVADQLVKHQQLAAQKAEELRQKAEHERIQKVEQQMHEQLETEKDEIKKKLKRAFEENLKIKVEHQKQKRLGVKQTIQMEEIRK